MVGIVTRPPGATKQVVVHTWIDGASTAAKPTAASTCGVRRSNSTTGGTAIRFSGIPFWGWDLGGFSGEIPSAELYLRGAAMAAFCPIMQYHSEFNRHRQPLRDRTPWNIQERSGDQDVISTLRFFVSVRHSLLPYIWQEAQHSAQTGQPMLRLWHREASEYQYYFGRDLLVCPVVEAGAQVWQVYLPPGAWVDLWTKQPYTGGDTVTMTAPLDRFPVFARSGSRIPARFGTTGQWGEAVPFDTDPLTVLTFE